MIDKAKLDSVGIDYSSAIKRFAGNEDLYHKFLNRFPEDKHMQAAEEAMKNGDVADVLEQVHAFKGIVSTLGMTALFQLCDQVVKVIRTGETDNLELLILKMKQEYDWVMTIF